MGPVQEFNEILSQKVVKCRTQNNFYAQSSYAENRVGMQKLLKWNICNIPFKSKYFISDLKGLFYEAF